MTRARDYLLLSGGGSLKSRKNSWYHKVKAIAKENYLNLTPEDFLNISVEPHQEKSEKYDLTSSDLEMIKKNLNFSPHPKDVIINATSMVNYLTYRRYYFLKNVVGIDRMPLIEDEQIRSRKALSQGTLAHKILELINLKTENQEEEIQLLINNYKKVLDIDLTEQEIEEVRNNLRRFLQTDFGKLLWGSVNILREVPFKLSLLKNDFYHFIISGKIDCLWEKNNELYVVDYKYSSSFKDGKTNYRNQLLIYTLALKAQTVKKIIPTLVFLKDCKIENIEVSNEILFDFERKLLNCGHQLLSLQHHFNMNSWERTEEKVCKELKCEFLSKYCKIKI